MSALNVAVLGAGNWGTTLAAQVAGNGHPTRLWTRDEAQREELATQRTNRRTGLAITLPPGVWATTSLAEALKDAELVLVALPSQAFREVMANASAHLFPSHMLVHGTKGLEAGTHARMSQLVLAETCVRQLGVVAGPNLAPEVAAGLPAATVAASVFPRVVAAVKRALSSPRLMVFSSRDVLGVELCGALKNVVAIAAGMADQMAVGENAKAFLMTRGMIELMRLGAAMGAEPSTMWGLAGIGDLMVTCSSPRSRNHRVGVALAKGQPLGAVLAELGMVAEGVYASRSARALAAEHGLDLPLFERIDQVLHEGLSAPEALEQLMRLQAGADVPHLRERPGAISG
jgi:glycerol-3-phosphate dehydrogenase (NAD(P)+)